MEKNGATKRRGDNAGSDDRDHAGSGQSAKISSRHLKIMTKMAGVLEWIRKLWGTRDGLESGSRIQRLERFSEVLTHLRSLFLSIFFFIAAIALIVIIVRQLTTNSVLVEPISVPAALAQKGYTPKIIAQRIVDEIFKIQRKATTVKERRSLMPEWSQLDVQMPGAGVSVKTVGRIIKESMGIPETQINGEVVMVIQEFRLRLRFDGGRHTSEIPPLPADRLDDMFHLGAQQAVKIIDPFMLASYFHVIKNHAGMMEMIHYCLKNDRKQDDHWANNLWGMQRAGEKKWEEAIEKYKTAVKIDPEFALAYNNWGNALQNQGKYRKAIEKYRKAVKIDPEFALAYNNWGNALEKEGQYAEAIAKYEKAITIDSDFTDANDNWGIALSNWGVAYMRRDNYDKAIEKFERAVKKNPKHANAYTHLGRAYSRKKNCEAAIENYGKALEIKPENTRIRKLLKKELEKCEQKRGD